MPSIEDPAMAFLHDHLLPLRERGGATYAFAEADPAADSYFEDCVPTPGGDVRAVSEDVGDMLRELAARWRAEGRDDLAGLEEPLLVLAAALLESGDETEAAQPLSARLP